MFTILGASLFDLGTGNMEFLLVKPYYGHLVISTHFCMH